MNRNGTDHPPNCFMILLHKLHTAADRVPVAAWVAVFLVFAAGLAWLRVTPYGGHLSALIGLQKEFLDANPGADFPGLVVFRDSGYDGQFFYLTARYLFDPDLHRPVMDTYTMRMGRVGMSLLTGIGPALFGWRLYPLFSLALLHGVHILSFFALREMLSTERKGAALVYLFSPFSMDSTILLVSDSLMTAVALIGLLTLERSGFRLSAEKQDHTKFDSPWILASAVLFCYLVLMRETALFFLAPIGLLYLLRRNVKGMLLAGLPIIVFFAWTAYVKTTEIHAGTNPIHYGARLAIPFQGLIQSLSLPADLSAKALARESSKLLNALFLFVLLFGLFRLRTLRGFVLALPLILAAALSIVAVRDYWVSFDNVARMFALSLPWSILLRDRLPEYRGEGINSLSVFLFLLLCLRVIWLKSALPFDVIGG